jgi:hypothetical protein
MISNSTGNSNAAFGNNALGSSSAVSFTSAFGVSALGSNSTGSGNAAFGNGALSSNTSGGSNSAFGLRTMGSNTTGFSNSAFGLGAMISNSTGSSNAAFGNNALASSTAVSFTSAFGVSALGSNSTGTGNNAFGYTSLGVNTTGGSNTSMGYRALGSNTTGSFNTAHGYDALFNNVTGSCHVAVGYLSGPSAGNLQNTIAIGCNVLVPASNRTIIGNAAMVSIGGYTNWTNLSDARFKTNVQENVPGINFIKKLRPVTYNYDLHAFDKFSDRDESAAADCYPDARDAKEKIVYTGFIAQEVEKAAGELGYDFSGIDKPQHDQASYALRYAEFVVPLVKAVQEQQGVIEAQQKKIETQDKKIEAQQTELTDVKQRLERLEAVYRQLEIFRPDHD